MQFIIIEWEVYNLTKDPLSLGLIGLCEVIPAISMALFAGHIVDQNEKKKLFVFAVSAFLLVSVGYYYVTSPFAYANHSSDNILFGIYLLVFAGGFIRSFFGPIIFSLVALMVPKKYTLMQQHGAVLHGNWQQLLVPPLQDFQSPGSEFTLLWELFCHQ